MADATTKERTGRWMTGDHINRTATQVRLGADVHTMSGRWFDRAIGHVYGTDCGEEVRAQAGAVLTTREATRQHCVGVPSIKTGGRR